MPFLGLRFHATIGCCHPILEGSSCVSPGNESGKLAPSGLGTTGFLKFTLPSGLWKFWTARADTGKLVCQTPTVLAFTKVFIFSTSVYKLNLHAPALHTQMQGNSLSLADAQREPTLQSTIICLLYTDLSSNTWWTLPYYVLGLLMYTGSTNSFYIVLMLSII